MCVVCCVCVFVCLCVCACVCVIWYLWQTSVHNLVLETYKSTHHFITLDALEPSQHWQIVATIAMEDVVELLEFIVVSTIIYSGH